MQTLTRYLDPRRSLASAIGWLVFALSIGLALTASVWVDDIVRNNLLDQRSRQLGGTADDIVDELNLSFALRLQSVRALASMLATELRTDNRATLRKILQNLQHSSPEFERIVLADAQGRVLASTHSGVEGGNVADRAWFALGLKGKSVGDVRVTPMEAKPPSGATGGAPGALVELIASVIDARGNTVGVIGIQMSKRWLLDLAGSLGDKLREEAGTEALLLDQDGRMLIGASSIRGARLEHANGATDTTVPMVAVNAPAKGVERRTQVERLADGKLYLVARATPGESEDLRALGWRVLVLQPYQDATLAATILQGRITAVLLGLGLLAALLGVWLAYRVTRGLDAIARSADALRTGATQSIAVPRGRNEVARLGRALDGLLTSLQHERSALQALNVSLDQRVAERTREVERLADQARYAAVVRERLKIARDLHDTLAHSMMAMLAEIRLLKRISVADPGAMAEELTRAEETAHQGLKEARAAITQMRFNPVRDAGLAAALGDFVKLFVERTGIQVDFTSDAHAGAFADERAETLFRIAEEAMRNVERHAGATQVTIALHELPDGHGLTLTIADNGVGFDADAAHPGHYGLAGLREQAQLIGADLTIRSSPHQGTTIGVALAPGRKP